MHRNVCLHLPVTVSERLYHFPPTKVLASLLGTERHRTVLKFSNVYTHTHTHTHTHTTFSRQVNGSYCFLSWGFFLCSFRSLVRVRSVFFRVRYRSHSFGDFDWLFLYFPEGLYYLTDREGEECAQCRLMFEQHCNCNATNFGTRWCSTPGRLLPLASCGTANWLNSVQSPELHRMTVVTGKRCVTV